MRELKQMAHNYVREHGHPDVIHGHNTLFGGIGAHAISRELGIPYVITEHSSQFHRNSINRHLRGQAIEAIQSASTCTAVSRSLAEMISLISGSPCSVIPNIVDLDFFLRPTGYPLKKFRVICAANLISLKRVDLLLRAFRCVVEMGDSFELRVIGDGPERKTLERLASHLGISQSVMFLGRMNRQELREQYWESDIAVLVSESETFSLFLLEAAAAGLRVVSTDSGGPRDFISEVDGVLLPRDATPEMIRDAIVSVAQEPVTRHRANSVRQDLVSRYSSDAVSNQILDIYRLAVSDRLA